MSNACFVNCFTAGQLIFSLAGPVIESTGPLYPIQPPPTEVGPISTFKMNRKYVMKYRLASLLLFGFVLAAAPAFAQDFSDDINNPNVFNIGPLAATFNITNSVFESDLSTGVTSNPTGDIDFFNVVVASGFQLDSVTLNTFSGGGEAFFGVGGPTLGGNPAIGAQQGAFVSSALGFTLIDGTESSLFNDLALGLGTNVPGNPLSPGQSLPAGTYAFVFQNTGSNTNGYELTFSGSEVVAVPEPSSAIAIIALGLTMVTRRRRS